MDWLTQRRMNRLMEREVRRLDGWDVPEDPPQIEIPIREVTVPPGATILGLTSDNKVVFFSETLEDFI